MGLIDKRACRRLARGTDLNNDLEECVEHVVRPREKSGSAKLAHVIKIFHSCSSELRERSLKLKSLKMGDDLRERLEAMEFFPVCQ